MAPYFTDVLSHEDGYPRKPDPAAFVEMMQRHHFTREDTLAIGDRDIDTLAAQGAGLRACLFGIPGGQVIPDMAITDYAELLKILTARS
jgi:phosphoglycolate phosphatase-like HAD superfamily hydrolase